ncbi:hypothetical protein J5N97_020772 [Dioscorea zingiberensis]|uniref:CCHC-type domain-containing protein n=1 Tax=Dioscorea zingiberensis TaxID=325984 RepID=A0A9D5HE22_9LILI|nr:hypothetical protein J5N97_020772 [Dioscorea zingiberensis]
MSEEESSQEVESTREDSAEGQDSGSESDVVTFDLTGGLVPFLSDRMLGLTQKMRWYMGRITHNDALWKRLMHYNDTLVPLPANRGRMYRLPNSILYFSEARRTRPSVKGKRWCPYCGGLHELVLCRAVWCLRCGDFGHQRTGCDSDSPCECPECDSGHHPTEYDLEDTMESEEGERSSSSGGSLPLESEREYYLTASSSENTHEPEENTESVSLERSPSPADKRGDQERRPRRVGNAQEYRQSLRAMLGQDGRGIETGTITALRDAAIPGGDGDRTGVTGSVKQ